MVSGAPCPLCCATLGSRGGSPASIETDIDMTLEQLRTFVAVAERQHVTQAARALNLAQSAVSHAITALEARHDTKLFDRVGRGIELTEAGRIFLAEARAVLARAEAAELALSELGSLKRGTLSVQASQTIASYWLPRHLVAFRRTYLQIQIRLAIGNTAQVAAAVASGAVELARNGIPVTVVETSRQLGGRARRVRFGAPHMPSAAHIDNGQHVLMR